MEWFENEKHWRTLYPLLFDRKRFASAAREVRLVLDLACLSPPARILDLGCGPARHAVHLAKLGFEVTGVDRSRFLLNKASQRMKAARVQIEFVEADMREFSRLRAYDLILNLYTSFGYFQTRRDDLNVLRQVFANLRSGGRFVLETINKEFIASQRFRTNTQQLPDGARSIQRYQPLGNWSRIGIEWALVHKDHVTSFAYQHNLYSEEEFVSLFSEAGFATVQFYGSLAKMPSGHNSSKLVALATR